MTDHDALSQTKEEIYPTFSWDGKPAHVTSREDYDAIYQKSVQLPAEYWSEVATKELTWFHPFEQVISGDFASGEARWFEGGKINASYNCLDRHVHAGKGSHVAFIWDGDEPGKHQEITYQQAFTEVNKLANVLIQHGVRKGQRVAIYMPMVPEAAYAMLACSRIGAVHSVVFAGFSAEALRSRILDADCHVLITANVGVRGGRTIQLKQTVDKAVVGTDVKSVLVYKHVHHPQDVPMTPGKDFCLREEMDKQRGYCPPEWMDAEDPLFMLYTSGSTGKPKGLIHTTGGYLTYSSHTSRFVWDLHLDDVFACTADVGWITGHTYVVYGPLLQGVTSVIFESVPTYPNASRYWNMIQDLKVTQFYTAPTAIRTLMALGDEHARDLVKPSLRILGSVGEPINPEAWRWYHNVVGQGKCAVVDTWFQTETGAICIAPLASAIPTKPGSATLPFFGQQPILLDPHTAQPITGAGEGVLALAAPWPGLARTIHNDHARYLQTYFEPYKGYYFTGDGAKRDQDGYLWITGRIDDVINKCGHRIGTAEIESALVLHASCAEAAVVAIPDEVRGQAIVAFVILSAGQKESSQLEMELKLQVRTQIGSLATPDHLIILPGLPKTRSGKIMRRVLRKVAENQIDQLGDTSTLADPDVVEVLIKRVLSVIYHQTS